MQQKILITGAAGFIGSHLVDALLKKGFSILGIDNLSLGKKENLSEALKNKDFNLHILDLCDASALDRIFEQEKFDIVFHLAANSDVSKGFYDTNTDLNNTFLTTYNVLNCMRKYEVKNLIFSSTSAVYGDTNDFLVNEHYGPLFPVSHYGAGKLASEAFISSFVHSYGIKAWICRFPNVIGSRSTHGVIFDFIQKLNRNSNELEVLGNGEQNKPYMYVTDLVNAILFVWENSHEPLNYFNLGVSTRTKVKDIARMVIEKVNPKAVIKYTGGNTGWVGDVPFFRYDLSKLKSLGWKETISSDEAVKKSVDDVVLADYKNPTS